MSAVEEKQPVETGEQVAPKSHQESSSDFSDGPTDPKAESRLVTKLDFIIFPTFFVIYMMSFLDRINISNARIQGMVADLDLTGNRFNVALFVSFQRMNPCHHHTELTLYRLITSPTSCWRFRPIWSSRGFALPCTFPH